MITSRTLRDKHKNFGFKGSHLSRGGREQKMCSREEEAAEEQKEGTPQWKANQNYATQKEGRQKCQDQKKVGQGGIDNCGERTVSIRGTVSRSVSIRKITRAL